MATWQRDSDYELFYINGDGTTTNSPFKAHWDAELFLDFGRYIIPSSFIYGY
jgi:hypothetical protein